MTTKIGYVDGRGRELLRSPSRGRTRNVAPGKSFATSIDLPLKALVPGRYTLRVEALADGLRDPIARDVVFEGEAPDAVSTSSPVACWR